MKLVRYARPRRLNFFYRLTVPLFFPMHVKVEPDDTLHGGWNDTDVCKINLWGVESYNLFGVTSLRKVWPPYKKFQQNRKTRIYTNEHM